MNFDFMRRLIGLSNNRSGTTWKRINYRTKNKRSDYVFVIGRLNNGSIRVYIVDQPGYGLRDTDDYSTHRHNDGHYYICWSDPIHTTQQAEQIAAIWADKTEDYILYGTRF